MEMFLHQLQLQHHNLITLITVYQTNIGMMDKNHVLMNKVGVNHQQILGYMIHVILVFHAQALELAQVINHVYKILIAII